MTATSVGNMIPVEPSVKLPHCSRVWLRSYQAPDRPAVFELLHGLPELYPNGSAWLHARLDRVLQHEAYCTLAVQGERLVGIMIETPKSGERLKLSTLYVSPAYRGIGVGRMLVEAGMRRWIGKRLHYVYVTVDHRLVEQFKQLLGPHGFETIAMDLDRYGTGRHEAILGRSL
jgi:ribosomal protein S18 acetylase RimI-like enzyme